MNVWISVREHLPEPYKMVWVRRRGYGDKPEKGCFDLRKLQWRVNGRLTRRVTHWREMSNQLTEAKPMFLCACGERKDENETD